MHHFLGGFLLSAITLPTVCPTPGPTGSGLASQSPRRFPGASEVRGPQHLHSLPPCGDCPLLPAAKRPDSPFSLCPTPHSLDPLPEVRGAKLQPSPGVGESAAFQCLLFMNGKQFCLQNIKWLGQLWEAEPLIRRHLLLL